MAEGPRSLDFDLGVPSGTKGLKAIVAVFITPQGTFPFEEELKRLLGARTQGAASCLGILPLEGVALLSIPRLIPGTRLRALLDFLGLSPSVVREVGEFRALLAAADDLLSDVGRASAEATWAMADALGFDAPRLTMQGLQDHLRAGLGIQDLYCLSHFDVLLVGASPPMDKTRVLLAQQMGRDVVVVMHQVTTLEQLTGRLRSLSSRSHDPF